MEEELNTQLQEEVDQYQQAIESAEEERKLYGTVRCPALRQTLKLSLLMIPQTALMTLIKVSAAQKVHRETDFNKTLTIHQ